MFFCSGKNALTRAVCEVYLTHLQALAPYPVETKRYSKKYPYCWKKKIIAFFVLISFTLLNVVINPNYSYAQHLVEGIAPSTKANFVDLIKLFDLLSLPEELGSIQDKFTPKEGKSDQLVLYLQDAHTNYDSEINVRRLIRHFQKEYHLPLVLLEGGEGKLDSLFFKSFPDEKTKEKILNDYVSKGELSGGEVASILNEEYDTDYYGIETQALYNENKQAFLKAMEKEKEISTLLTQIESELMQKSDASFSDPVKTFREKQKAFREESIDLIEYLKMLKAFSPKEQSFQDHYPELEKILTAESNEKRFKGEDFDAAMTQLIKTFQQKVLPKLPREKQIEINQMIQLYRIGQLNQGMLVDRMEQISKEMNFSLRAPQVLKPTAQHARMISSIKGTKLFDELETLEKDLVKSLPQSDDERMLLENFQNLNLLKNFSKLELRDKDWQELKGKKPSQLLSGTMSFPHALSGNLDPSPKVLIGDLAPRLKHSGATKSVDSGMTTPAPQEDVLDSLFTAHFHFYQLAERRDEALFNNMLRVIKEKKAKLSVVVTGGFHSEGITKKLKESNIPFVLIAPKIDKIGDMSQYMNVMQGKISYMKYFHGSLWDALAQDYSAKLAASLKEEDLTPSLKRWRDRIIQNSIAEGRVTQAGSYTKYVDALVQALRKEYEKGSPVGQLSEDEIKAKLSKELDSFIGTYFKKIEGLIKQKLEVFSSGLEEMWKSGDITPKAVGDLLNRMSAVKTSNLAVAIALIRSGFGASTLPETLQKSALNETKALFSEQSPEFQKIVADLALKYVQNPELLEAARATIKVAGPGVGGVMNDLARAEIRNPNDADRVLAGALESIQKNAAPPGLKPDRAGGRAEGRNIINNPKVDIDRSAPQSLRNDLKPDARAEVRNFDLIEGPQKIISNSSEKEFLVRLLKSQINGQLYSQYSYIKDGNEIHLLTLAGKNQGDIAGETKKEKENWDFSQNPPRLSTELLSYTVTFQTDQVSGTVIFDPTWVKTGILPLTGKQSENPETQIFVPPVTLEPSPKLDPALASFTLSPIPKASETPKPTRDFGPITKYLKERLPWLGSLGEEAVGQAYEVLEKKTIPHEEILGILENGLLRNQSWINSGGIPNQVVIDIAKSTRRAEVRTTGFLKWPFSTEGLNMGSVLDSYVKSDADIIDKDKGKEWLSKYVRDVDALPRKSRWDEDHYKNVTTIIDLLRKRVSMAMNYESANEENPEVAVEGVSQIKDLTLTVPEAVRFILLGYLVVEKGRLTLVGASEADFAKALFTERRYDSFRMRPESWSDGGEKNPERNKQIPSRVVKNANEAIGAAERVFKKPTVMRAPNYKDGQLLNWMKGDLNSIYEGRQFELLRDVDDAIDAIGKALESAAGFPTGLAPSVATEKGLVAVGADQVFSTADENDILDPLREAYIELFNYRVEAANIQRSLARAEVRTHKVTETPQVEEDKLKRFAESLQDLTPENNDIINELSDLILQSRADPLRRLDHGIANQIKKKEDVRRRQAGLYALGGNYNPGKNNAPLKHFYQEAKEKGFLNEDGSINLASRAEVRVGTGGLNSSLIDFVNQQAEEVGLFQEARTNLVGMLESPYVEFRQDAIKIFESFPRVVAEKILNRLLSETYDTDLYTTYAVAANIGMFQNNEALRIDSRFPFANVVVYTGGARTARLNVRSTNGILTRAVIATLNEKMDANDDEFLSSDVGVNWLIRLLIIDDPANRDDQRKTAKRFLSAWRGSKNILELLSDLNVPTNVLDVLTPQDLNELVERRLTETQMISQKGLVKILKATDDITAEDLIELYFTLHSTHWDLDDLFALGRKGKLSKESVLKIRQQISRFQQFSQFAEAAIKLLDDQKRIQLSELIDNSNNVLTFPDLISSLQTLGPLPSDFPTISTETLPEDYRTLEKLLIKDILEYDLYNPIPTSLLNSYLLDSDLQTDNRLVAGLHAAVTVRPKNLTPQQVTVVERAGSSLEEMAFQNEALRSILESGIRGSNPVLAGGTGAFFGEMLRNLRNLERNKFLLDLALHPEAFLEGKFSRDQESRNISDSLSYPDMRSDILLYFLQQKTPEKAGLTPEEWKEVVKTAKELKLHNNSRELVMRYRVAGFSDELSTETHDLMNRPFIGYAQTDDLVDLFRENMVRDPQSFLENAQFILAGKQELEASRLSFHPSADNRIRALSQLLVESIQNQLAIAKKIGRAEVRVSKESISERRIREARKFIQHNRDQNILGMVIYGSVALGTAKKESDLDYILIQQVGSSTVPRDKGVSKFHKALSEKLPYASSYPMMRLILRSASDKKKYQYLDSVIDALFVRKGDVLNRRPGEAFIDHWRAIAKNQNLETRLAQLIKDRIQVVTRRGSHRAEVRSVEEVRQRIREILKKENEEIIQWSLKTQNRQEELGGYIKSGEASEELIGRVGPVLVYRYLSPSRSLGLIVFIHKNGSILQVALKTPDKVSALGGDLYEILDAKALERLQPSIRKRFSPDQLKEALALKETPTTQQQVFLPLFNLFLTEETFFRLLEKNPVWLHVIGKGIGRPSLKSSIKIFSETKNNEAHVLSGHSLEFSLDMLSRVAALSGKEQGGHLRIVILHEFTHLLFSDMDQAQKAELIQWIVQRRPDLIDLAQMREKDSKIGLDKTEAAEEVIAHVVGDIFADMKPQSTLLMPFISRGRIAALSKIWGSKLTEEESRKFQIFYRLNNSLLMVLIQKGILPPEAQQIFDRIPEKQNDVHRAEVRSIPSSENISWLQKELTERAEKLIRLVDPELELLPNPESRYPAIGLGAEGEVYQVKRKQDGKILALKFPFKRTRSLEKSASVGQFVRSSTVEVRKYFPQLEAAYRLMPDGNYKLLDLNAPSLGPVNAILSEWIEGEDIVTAYRNGDISPKSLEQMASNIIRVPAGKGLLIYDTNPSNYLVRHLTATEPSLVMVDTEGVDRVSPKDAIDSAPANQGSLIRDIQDAAAKPERNPEIQELSRLMRGIETLNEDEKIEKQSLPREQRISKERAKRFKNLMELHGQFETQIKQLKIFERREGVLKAKIKELSQSIALMKTQNNPKVESHIRILETRIQKLEERLRKISARAEVRTVSDGGDFNMFDLTLKKGIVDLEFEDQVNALIEDLKQRWLDRKIPVWLDEFKDSSFGVVQEILRERLETMLDPNKVDEVLQQIENNWPREGMQQLIAEYERIMGRPNIQTGEQEIDEIDASFNQNISALFETPDSVSGVYSSQVNRWGSIDEAIEQRIKVLLDLQAAFLKQPVDLEQLILPENAQVQAVDFEDAQNDTDDNRLESNERRIAEFVQELNLGLIEQNLGEWEQQGGLEGTGETREQVERKALQKQNEIIDYLFLLLNAFVNYHLRNLRKINGSLSSINFEPESNLSKSVVKIKLLVTNSQGELKPFSVVYAVGELENLFRLTKLLWSRHPISAETKAKAERSLKLRDQTDWPAQFKLKVFKRAAMNAMRRGILGMKGSRVGFGMEGFFADWYAGLGYRIPRGMAPIGMDQPGRHQTLLSIPFDQFELTPSETALMAKRKWFRKFGEFLQTTFGVALGFYEEERPKGMIDKVRIWLSKQNALPWDYSSFDSINYRVRETLRTFLESASEKLQGLIYRSDIQAPDVFYDPDFWGPDSVKSLEVRILDQRKQLDSLTLDMVKTFDRHMNETWKQALDIAERIEKFARQHPDFVKVYERVHGPRTKRYSVEEYLSQIRQFIEEGRSIAAVNAADLHRAEVRAVESQPAVKRVEMRNQIQALIDRLRVPISVNEKLSISGDAVRRVMATARVRSKNGGERTVVFMGSVHDPNKEEERKFLTRHLSPMSVPKDTTFLIEQGDPLTENRLEIWLEDYAKHDEDLDQELKYLKEEVIFGELDFIAEMARGNGRRTRNMDLLINPKGLDYYYQAKGLEEAVYYAIEEIRKSFKRSDLIRESPDLIKNVVHAWFANSQIEISSTQLDGFYDNYLRVYGDDRYFVPVEIREDFMAQQILETDGDLAVIAHTAHIVEILKRLSPEITALEPGEIELGEGKLLELAMLELLPTKEYFDWENNRNDFPEVTQPIKEVARREKATLAGETAGVEKPLLAAFLQKEKISEFSNILEKNRAEVRMDVLETFLQLNPEVQRLHQTLPEVYEQLRKGDLNLSAITFPHTSRLEIPTNQDKEYQYFLSEIVINGTSYGSVLFLRNAKGEITEIGIENPSYTQDGIRFLAQLDHSDPLWQIFRNKIAAQNATVDKDSNQIVYLPWILNESEADEIRALIGQNAILKNLFESQKIPTEQMSVRGVFTLLPSPNLYLGIGHQNEKLATIFRLAGISASDFVTLAHEMGHFLLDNVFKDKDSAQKIERFVQRNHYSFYRNLGSPHPLARGSYSFVQSNQVMYQEVLLHLYNGFLDRSGVAMSASSEDFVQSGDVELFVELGLLPDWASPSKLGFQKGYIDGGYYEKLELEATKQGLKLIPVLPGLWETIHHIVQKLNDLVKDFDKKIKESGQVDSLKPPFQWIPSREQNPLAISQIAVLAVLVNLVYQAERNFQGDNREPRKKLLSRILKEFQISFGNLRDEHHRTMDDFLNMNGTVVHNLGMRLSEEERQFIQTGIKNIVQAISPKDQQALPLIAGLFTPRAEVRMKEIPGSERHALNEFNDILISILGVKFRNWASQNSSLIESIFNSVQSLNPDSNKDRQIVVNLFQPRAKGKKASRFTVSADQARNIIQAVRKIRSSSSLSKVKFRKASELFGKSNLSLAQRKGESVGEAAQDEVEPEYERDINESDLDRVAQLLNRNDIGLGFILNYIGYTRTKLKEGNLPERAYLVRQMLRIEGSKEHPKVRGEILIPDFHRNFDLEFKRMFDFYPQLVLQYYPDLMSHLNRPEQSLVRRILQQYPNQDLPPRNKTTLQELMKTVIFHEVGEIIWAVLMSHASEDQTDPAIRQSALQIFEEWKRLMNEALNSSSPGVTIVKNLFKEAENPDDVLITNMFADKFVLFVDPESAYMKFGERLTDEEKAFFQKIKPFLEMLAKKTGDPFTLPPARRAEVRIKQSQGEQLNFESKSAPELIQYAREIMEKNDKDKMIELRNYAEQKGMQAIVGILNDKLLPLSFFIQYPEQPNSPEDIRYPVEVYGFYQTPFLKTDSAETKQKTRQLDTLSESILPGGTYFILTDPNPDPSQRKPLALGKQMIIETKRLEEFIKDPELIKIHQQAVDKVGKKPVKTVVIEFISGADSWGDTAAVARALVGVENFILSTGRSALFIPKDIKDTGIRDIKIKLVSDEQKVYEVKVIPLVRAEVRVFTFSDVEQFENQTATVKFQGGNNTPIQEQVLEILRVIRSNIPTEHGEILTVEFGGPEAGTFNFKVGVPLSSEYLSTDEINKGFLLLLGIARAEVRIQTALRTYIADLEGNQRASIFAVREALEKWVELGGNVIPFSFDNDRAGEIYRDLQQHIHEAYPDFFSDEKKRQEVNASIEEIKKDYDARVDEALSREYEEKINLIEEGFKNHPRLRQTFGIKNADLKKALQSQPVHYLSLLKKDLEGFEDQLKNARDFYKQVPEKLLPQSLPPLEQSIRAAVQAVEEVLAEKGDQKPGVKAARAEVPSPRSEMRTPLASEPLALRAEVRLVRPELSTQLASNVAVQKKVNPEKMKADEVKAIAAETGELFVGLIARELKLPGVKVLTEKEREEQQRMVAEKVVKLREAGLNATQIANAIRPEIEQKLNDKIKTARDKFSEPVISRIIENVLEKFKGRDVSTLTGDEILQAIDKAANDVAEVKLPEVPEANTLVSGVMTILTHSFQGRENVANAPEIVAVEITEEQMNMAKALFPKIENGLIEGNGMIELRSSFLGTGDDRLQNLQFLVDMRTVQGQFEFRIVVQSELERREINQLAGKLVNKKDKLGAVPITVVTVGKELEEARTSKPAAIAVTDNPESMQSWLQKHPDSRAFNSNEDHERKPIPHNPDSFKQIMTGVAAALTLKTIQDLGLIEDKQTIEAVNQAALKGLLMAMAQVIAAEARSRRAMARAA